MRYTLLLISILVLASCKEEKEEVPTNPFTRAYAGQYLIRAGGDLSRTVSERYILSPTGQAERHKLVRNSRFGEYRLDSIIRGSWEAGDGRISINLEGGGGLSSETYLRELQVNPADSLRTDTLWLETAGDGRRLELLVRF